MQLFSHSHLFVSLGLGTRLILILYGPCLRRHLATGRVTNCVYGLTLTAPANAYLAPPGYYMLFLFNNNGVPSVAPFVQLTQ
jgi:hypothetical protein